MDMAINIKEVIKKLNHSLFIIRYRITINAKMGK